MSLSILSQGSDRGSPFNEDLAGAANGRIWLLDGATGLAPSRFEGSSDAQWLVRAFSRHFESAGEGETIDILRHAIEDVRAQYIATGPLPEALYAMPSAGLSLVREINGSIEIASLADVKAWVCFRDGSRRVVGGGPLEALDAALIAELARFQAAHGPVDLTASRAHVEPLVRANRERMNRADGYWVLSLDAVCLTGLEIERFEAAEVSHVLLATDGFYDLWEHYEPGSFEAVLAQLEAGQGEAVIERLRTIEREDAQGARFPRFKRHDDASWVLIAVEPNLTKSN